ncbi:protein-tyrosine phosphatase-like protein [Auriculariales sp. MPI-PUGE-AT-0066]|nr:protein-tyrosine phosphatase-like protein [Auriculariales sp. MPI-PUGE-AT-0066]
MLLRPTPIPLLPRDAPASSMSLPRVKPVLKLNPAPSFFVSESVELGARFLPQPEVKRVKPSLKLDPTLSPAEHVVPKVKPALKLAPTLALFATESSEGMFLPQANEILPRVYLSDLSTAQCRKTLVSLGITHLVSVMPGSVELPYDLFARTMQVPITDMPFSDLLTHLNDTCAFIEDALKNPNARVLVHCAKGRSRSCSVVAAHLIATHGLTVAQAVEHIKERRRIAMPNIGFYNQLQEFYETTNAARRGL